MMKLHVTAPGREEFENILDLRNPVEAYAALWRAHEEAAANAELVDSVVSNNPGLGKSRQQIADFLLWTVPPRMTPAESVQEILELGPESLEKENFRIDSTGWTVRTLDNGTRVKTNPECDVTELLEGEFAGEQHFTWHAAMRETAKAGKRMPTREEWLEIIRSRHPDVDSALWWQDAPGIAEALGLPLAGFRHCSSAAYYNQGTYGHYWASSPGGADEYLVLLSATQVFPANNNYRAHGFSVRCLKN